MSEAWKALTVALAATLLAVAVWWGWSVWGESGLVIDEAEAIASSPALVR